MKPVFQTRYGEGNGNCFQAALASILELDLDDVPDFVNTYNLDDGEWYRKYVEWLGKIGLTVVVIKWKDEIVIEQPNTIWLVTGPRIEDGVNHCVVYKGAELMHNPHEGCKGITPEWIDIIFPLDLSKYIKHSDLHVECVRDE